MTFLRPLVALCALALPAHAVTYFWNSGTGPAGGDGVSLYQEANWTTNEDGTGSRIPLIDPGAPITASSDLVVNSGIPGGGGGGSGTLDLNGGSLTVSAGTVRMSLLNSAGITNGSLTQSGGTIISQFVSSSTITLAGGALELNGGNNPLNLATVNFTAGSTATLHFLNETPADVRSEHLSKLTVNGQPAVEGANVFLSDDGGTGTLVSVSAPSPGDDSDGDLLTNGEETGTYGTDPFDADSDDDGTPDGMEIANGLDPNNPAERLDRPNIIFILVDDLGYGDLGVLFQNGKAGKKHFTPNLDQMAADGMILDRHYTPAPVCAPCRGSLLQGVHQGHANVRDNQFDKALQDNHTLATTLKAAGYSTSIIGKYGLQGGGGSPAAWPAYPTKRGFDYFFGYVRHGDGHTHYPDHVTDSRGLKELYDQDAMIRDDLDKCYTADLFTARAKKLIVDETTANPDKPFFLYLAFDTPHAALQLPTQAYPAGGGTTGGLQWNGTPGAMINTASGTIDSYRHPDYTTAVGNAWTDVEERFATSVRRIDDCVGDLRQTLTDLGIANNTLIVFTSDNGPHSEDYLSNAQTYDGSSYTPQSFDSYGLFEGTKRDTWEGGIRMPTLVAWPGTIAPGQTDSTPSQMHDWMPTFSELAGWTPPSRTDGVSLLPLLTGSGTQEPPLVYVEYSVGGNTPNYGDFTNHGGAPRQQMQAIFLDGYKGIRNNIASHATPFQIYDIAADASEGNNLAGTSSFFNELQQEMKDTVLRIRQVDGSAGRPYDGELVPPVSDPVEPGLEYAQYEGLWPWIPEFELLTATGQGDAPTVDAAAHLSRPDDAGLLYTGYLNVPADGTWTFFADSDAGTHLRVHESQVIDDDYVHNGSEASGAILLKAGLHPFRLYYRSRLEAPALAFSWSGPGVAKQPVPASAFFRAGTPAPEPAAGDDAATSTGNVIDIDVLANDSDDGAPSPLTISSAGPPATGSAVVVAGKVRYTPAPGFLGTDVFSYTITDGQFFATATVTVTVAYQGTDLWLPLNECAGAGTFQAGGVLAGFLSGFADVNAARIDGPAGKALSFDGVDDQVPLTGVPAGLFPLGGSPRTIMCWIRIPPGQALENQTMLGYGTNINGQRFSFRTNGSAGSPGGQELRLEVQGGNIVGNAVLDDGQWHHVAAVVDDFDGDSNLEVEETKFYIDGVLDTNPADTSEAIIPAGNSSARIIDTVAGSTPVLGGSNHATGYNFLGDIDELRLLPVALTTAQVQAEIDASRPDRSWHRRFFGAAPVDWNADDDADNLGRLLEYTLGGQPRIADAGTIRPSAFYNPATGKLEVTFRRRTAGSHDLLYAVEATTNLVDWNLLTTSEIASSLLSAEECLEWVTFETDADSSVEDSQFVRVAVELAP